MLIVFTAVCIAAVMKRKGIRTPYTRKTFHFIIFSAAGLLQYYYGLKAVSILGTVVFIVIMFCVWYGHRSWFYKALARETDAPHEKKFILLPLMATAAGGIISNLFFPGTAYIGYLVGGWGDAVGEPIGTRWGKHRYTVPTLFGVRATRSIEGSTAVMLVSTLVTLMCLQQASIHITTAVWYSLACGCIAAIVEAISSHGLDNLTMQVAAAGTVYLLM